MAELRYWWTRFVYSLGCEIIYWARGKREPSEWRYRALNGRSPSDTPK